MRYPHLFTEGSIGSVSIRNRTVMVPMVTGMANFDGTPSEKLVAYYEERARNGLGLLITEAARVNNYQAAAMPRQLSMASDRCIRPYGEMVGRMHELGTRVFCQVHHPGAQGLSMMAFPALMIEFLGNLWPGLYERLPKLFQLVGKLKLSAEEVAPLVRFPALQSPSGVPCRLHSQRARAMRRFEIEGLIDDFVGAAKRSWLAGADGVELHASHGYLIQQFLSPYYNRRNDAFGGSFENRLRFLLSIISGIKRECGNDYPIMVRLTVDEFLRHIGLDEGIILEEGVRIARRLEEAGVAAIDVSTATYDTQNYWLEPMTFEPGWRKNLVHAVKQAVSIPVLAVNMIRSPGQAEEYLAGGIQDFIGLGRPLLADGAWIAKAYADRAGETHRCISCLKCFESLQANGQVGESLECSVNPRLGREREYAVPATNGSGRVVVILGAGPAGLVAATVTAQRGFRTIVFERSGTVGGQLNIANKPPNKGMIDWFTEDMYGLCMRLGVEFGFNYEPLVSNITAFNPYAVFVATGSAPIVPRIPGVEQENVCTVNDVLEGRILPQGRSVAVIGSGLTGLETAELLAAYGNSVTIVEMKDRIGPDAYWQNLDDITGVLKEYDTDYVTGHRLIEVKGQEIKLVDTHSGAHIVREVDLVVLATGVVSSNDYVEKLAPYCSRVRPIGDARKPGRIYDATHNAFETAWNI